MIRDRFKLEEVTGAHEYLLKNSKTCIDVGKKLDELREEFDEYPAHIEFLTDGFLDVFMKDGSCFRYCVVCGERQALNINALERTDPDLAEEVEEGTIQWDNNKCEQRHPPFRSNRQESYEKERSYA